jgi:hypothetical protein
MIRRQPNRLPIIDDEQQRVPHSDTLPKKRTCETKPSSIPALRTIRPLAGMDDRYVHQNANCNAIGLIFDLQRTGSHWSRPPKNLAYPGTA